MRYVSCFRSVTTVCTALILVSVIATASCAEQISTPQPIPQTDVVIDPDVAAARWYEGNHSGSIAVYRQLVEQDPENQEYLLSLVVLLREQGHMAEALRYAANLNGALAAEHEATLALAGVPAGEPPHIDGETEIDAAVQDARYHFWRGVRYVAGEEYDQAQHQFSRAIETSEGGHYPYAHYALGQLSAARGEYGQAREAYRTALRQDGNLTDVFVPLARAHWELGDHRAAWDQLERARIALPWNDSIPVLLARWEDSRPSLIAGGAARDAARRAAATPPQVAPAPDASGDAAVIRVGLVENLDSVYLKTGGPFRLTTEETVVYQSANTAEPRVLEVSTLGGGIVITGENEHELYRGGAAVRLGYPDRTSTTTIFDMTYGHGQFSSGREDRSYRGEIEIFPREGSFTVINRLSVEEYLYSVVPSEMPAWWPQPALEAQAIAARSYTMYPRNRYGERGFDLLSSVTSAYYPGVTNEHPRTTAAVDATRGLVLQDGSRPLDAVYSANHAGYAEAAGSVWGWPNSLVATSDPLLPELTPNRSPATVYRWLVSRPDSYSGRPPYAGRSSYRWKLLVPRESIERRLADSGHAVGTVEAIIPGPRGITGRVESVTIRGSAGETEVRRDAIRSRLGGLRSNLFVVSAYAGPDLHPRRGAGESSSSEPREANEAPAYFYFQGAGWGHGVGMDQTGAAGMAEAGFDAETILNHYYPRNEVVQWY